MPTGEDDITYEQVNDDLVKVRLFGRPAGELIRSDGLWALFQNQRRTVRSPKFSLLDNLKKWIEQ